MTMQVVTGAMGNAPVVVGNISETLIADWLDYNKAKSPTTIKTYNAALKNFFGWLNINEVKSPCRRDVEEYSGELCKTKSLRTARLYVTAVKVFARWCSSIGVYLDFAAGVAAPALEEEEETHAREALELDEARKVLKSFSGKTDEKSLRDALMIRLMMNCGLRSVEVIRLDANDIEHRHNKIYLKVWGKGRKGKTARVEISKTIYNMILDYLNARHSKRKAGEPMFVSTSNRNREQRLQTQTVSRLAKRTLQSCGLDSATLTCHSLRHTAASLLLEMTDNIFAVQKFLRHRNPKTTQIYISDAAVRKNNSVSLLAALLDS